MEEQIYREVKNIFFQALEMEPSEADTFVVEAAQGRNDVIQHVQALIRTYRETTENTQEYVHDVAETIGNSIFFFPTDRYILVEKIGTGGMGAVYVGQRNIEGIKQKVAIKLLQLHKTDAVHIERFNRECRILSQLNHPNIAQFIDSDYLEDGNPYVVMEYTPGLPISEYCNLHEKTIQDRLQYFLDLCDALGYAHRNLIIHRDLKPTNILVTDEDTLKLIDFGIAKDISDEDKTATGHHVLTPAYASPEQFSGNAVNVTSDVYSLGVVLYELLSGLRPFDEQHKALEAYKPMAPSEKILKLAQSTSNKIANTGLNADRLAQTLKSDLDKIILKAIQFDPSQRYQSVAEFAADIQRYLNNEPVLAQEPSTAYKLKKFFKRHKLPSLLTALAATIAIVFVVTTIQQNAVIKKERDQAVREQQRAQAISDSFIQAFKNADPANTLGNQVTAEQILDETARLLERNNIIDPVLRSELAVTIAQVYNNMGEYDQSLKTLSIAHKEHDLLSNEMKQAIIIHKAKALGQIGQFKEALDLFEDNVNLNELDPRISIAKSDALKTNGDTDGAVALLKQTFEQISNTDPLYIDTCIALAKAIEFSNDHENIEPIFEQCEQNNQSEGDLSNIWSRVAMLVTLANYHEGTSKQTNELAEGRQKAIEYYEQAIQLQKRMFDEDHISYVEIYKKLGWNTMLNGEYEKALEYQNKAYAIYVKYYGENNPNTATAIFNSAHVYARMGDLDRAIEVYKEAIDIMIQAGEIKNHRLGFFYKALAGTENDAGYYEDGEKSARICQEIFDNKGGSYIYRGTECEVLLVEAYYGLGQIESARQQMTESLPDMYVMHHPGADMQVKAEKLAKELGVVNPYKEQKEEQ